MSRRNCSCNFLLQVKQKVVIPRARVALREVEASAALQEPNSGEPQ